jgi:cell division protein FtsW
VLVVGLFGALGVLGFRTALRSEDRFGMLLATGITTWFMVQAFINIGAVTGMMPITGVPLPFISAGGSSLLINLAATGLLLNIARRPRPESSRVAIARDQLLG